MRSKRSRSASRPLSATASGCSRKRSAIRSGGASTCEELPRRLRLGLVERRAQPHRDHRVLERDPLARVHVHVAGGDAGHSEPLGQLGEQPVAAAVVAPEGALELDAEAVGAEDRAAAGAPTAAASACSPRLDARGHRAVARAAGQADEPLGVALDVRRARCCGSPSSGS